MKKFTVDAIYIKGYTDTGGIRTATVTVCGYGMHSLLYRICDDVLRCGSYIISVSTSEVAISVSVPEADSDFVTSELVRDFFGVKHHGQSLGSM